VREEETDAEHQQRDLDEHHDVEKILAYHC